jgi:predicted flap endonuclease-1-like 5' DNA nuclease
LAQKLLDEAHTPVAEAASQIAPTENDAAENPTEGLAEGVQALTEHAGALAAAAPAALAANEAAQKLLAEAPPESAPTEKTAQPPSMPRPDLWADEDNLLLVRGIGPALSHDLHQVNIWRFGQIAAWTPEQVAWIARKFPHHGPVAPRFWPAQAQLLAGGVMTDYARAHLAGETLQGAPLDDTSILAWHAALPRAIAPDANDELYAGQRPLSLLHPPLGESDDLSRIDGVDAPLAARLNALGVWTWGQIAHWSAENARWIGAYLADPGRVEREAWVAQAKGLVA